MEAPGSLPLPEEPALAAMAVALRDAGHWADVVDRDWRLVYSTDDHRRICGGLTDFAAVAPGEHYFGPEKFSLSLQWRSGPNTVDQLRELFGVLGGLVLADTAEAATSCASSWTPCSATSSISSRPSTRRRRVRSGHTERMSAHRSPISSRRCASTMPPDDTSGLR
jgi:hypothetical protein